MARHAIQRRLTRDLLLILQVAKTRRPQPSSVSSEAMGS